MINAIIFSKDRASQLRLLLESMWLRAYNMFDSVSIIYTASTEKFAHGYWKLQEENMIPNIVIDWVQQMNLPKDTIETMEKCKQGPDSFITFFTDDSLFYRRISDYKFPIESTLTPGNDIACFSLRLGTNTGEQIYWVTGYHISLKYTKVGDFIKWRHGDYPVSHGYGYPTSVDGHIFRASEITSIIKQIGHFKGVNALEGALCNYKHTLPPCMASFEKSALVTVPINRVQNDCQNNFGMFYGIPQEELNSRYLAGEVIDFNAIDFSYIKGTHQELEYKFRRL